MMAFYMDYPNAFDKMAGRTGFDIMLHATNEPERLKKDYDSKGCIVVQNEEINEIYSYIRLQMTPIVVFSELTEEYLQPNSQTELTKFFSDWITAWQGKSIDNYMNHYHSGFSTSGKNKEQWKGYKTFLNRRYDKIEIVPENVRYFRHPKYSVIIFIQNYHSTLRGGSRGHHSRGTKILYIAEEAGQPKIIAEKYTTQL